MEEKLIEAVQMFPCLYNKQLKEYRNKLTEEKSWASVANAVGATIDQCQTRWRSLRDRYVREMSGKPKSGAAAEEKVKWRHMDAMSFLQRYVAPRSTFSNMKWNASEQQGSMELKDVYSDITEESSSWSENALLFDSNIMTQHCDINDSTITSPSSFEESTCNESESTYKKTQNRRQKVQEEAHKKFDALCGAVTDLIASRKERSEKSRNADFLNVLDCYLLKHTEEEQDKLKIQILNLVYPTN